MIHVLLLIGVLIQTSMAFNHTVYYAVKTYWNDIPVVNQEIEKRMHPDKPWFRYLLDKNNNKPYSNVLSINAGNGWVERMLIHHGVITSALCTDLMQQFVDDANSKAEEENINLKYIKLNVNEELLPTGPFDLVLIYAGAHHVGKIDHLFSQISEVLLPSGFFVFYEYTGPHRNQYDAYTWKAIKELNARIPEKYRQDTTDDKMYPHLPTMLVNDASEAQHSELIMETLKRYFFIQVRRSVGGALAYPLLTHNKQLHSYPYSETEDICKMIMDYDAKWLAQDLGRSVFTFVVASPLQGGIPSSWYRSLLKRQENKREIKGITTKYYTPVVLDPSVQLFDSIFLEKS